MPGVSSNYQRNVGVVLEVFIIKEQVNSLTPNKQIPPISIRPYRALLDTGATVTCISSKVVKEVGLESIGLGKIISASATTTAHKYFFVLGIPIIGKVNPENKQATGVVHQFPPIQGCEFHTEQNTNYDVLLGMDIITNGSLKIERDGHFSFWF